VSAAKNKNIALNLAVNFRRDINFAIVSALVLKRMDIKFRCRYRFGLSGPLNVFLFVFRYFYFIASRAAAAHKFLTPASARYFAFLWSPATH
jgi:hypothetical protein